MSLSIAHKILSEVATNFSKSKLERLENIELDKYIDESLLKLFRKIAVQSDISNRISIIKLYLKLFRETQSKDTNLMIKLCNDGIEAVEILKGSEYNDEIEYRVYHILTRLSKFEVLAYNQYQAIAELLEKQENKKIAEQLERINKELHDGEIFGIHMLINLFCSFQSYRDQFIYLESSLINAIESFKSVKSFEIFVQIFNFLNTILMHPTITIEYMGKIVTYSRNSIIYYTLHKDAFIPIYSIIKIILETDILISQNLIKIIPKL